MIWFGVSVGFVKLPGHFKGMKNVDVVGIREFKIPEDWIFTQDDNIMYITDKPISEEDYKLYLIGFIEFGWGREYEEILNELFGDVEHMGIVRSFHGFIGGERCYIVQYKVNDIIENKYQIYFYHDEDYKVTLINWDGLVDEDTMVKIAHSRIPEMKFPTLLVVLVAVEMVIVVLVVLLLRKEKRKNHASY